MHMLVRNEAEVRQTLGLIKAWNVIGGDVLPNLDGLVSLIDWIRKAWLNEWKIIWPEVFLNLGRQVYRILVHSDSFDEGDFVSHLFEKHRRYGAEPIERWSEIGVIIRIDSKIHRAINLQNADGNLDEPAESDGTTFDTLRDILGYCVLGYAFTTATE